MVNHRTPFVRLSVGWLRASTRVSSGFAPLRHSSPSFGSRQARSHSNPSHKIEVGRRCTLEGIPPVSFLAPYGFSTRRLARMSDSLVRVSRRAGWGARRPTPGARWCRGTPEGARCLPQSRRRRFHERLEGPSLGRRRDPRRSTPRADRRTGREAVPHPTGAHRRPPSASLPTISSTL